MTPSDEVELEKVLEEPLAGSGPSAWNSDEYPFCTSATTRIGVTLESAKPKGKKKASLVTSLTSVHAHLGKKKD